MKRKRNKAASNAASLRWYYRNKEKANAKGKAWYKRNKKKAADYAYKKWLERRYGLTVAEHQAMLSRQDGKCAICGGEQKNRRLAVDHDHESMVTRGLLCGLCNTSLERLEAIPDWPERAREYLAKWGYGV